MTTLEIRCDPYDFLGPLARGEVDTELSFSFDHGPGWRSSPLGSGDVSEASTSHLVTAAAHGIEFPRVAVPIFMARGMRHRCFYVPADSPLTTLAELAGRRVVTNSWFDTGNTWSRAALREQGVDLASISWSAAPVVSGGPVKLADEQGRMPPVPFAAVEDADTILDVLASGRADAALIPIAPLEALASGAVRRLLPRYWEDERAYLDRTGMFPILHTLTVDRALVERDPDLPRKVFDALAESQQRWQTRALGRSGGPLWFLRSFEETIEIFGREWQYHGLQSPANRAALEGLVREMAAQGHIDAPIPVAGLYPAFDQQHLFAPGSLPSSGPGGPAMLHSPFAHEVR